MQTKKGYDIGSGRVDYYLLSAAYRCRFSATDNETVGSAENCDFGSSGCGGRLSICLVCEMIAQCNDMGFMKNSRQESNLCQNVIGTQIQSRLAKTVRTNLES